VKKEQDPCRATVGETADHTDGATQTDTPSTAGPDVVNVGTRPVVAIGPLSPTTTPTPLPDPFIPALHSPDRGVDRADDYVFVGQRGKDNEERELADPRYRERAGLAPLGPPTGITHKF